MSDAQRIGVDEVRAWREEPFDDRHRQQRGLDLAPEAWLQPVRSNVIASIATVARRRRDWL